MKQFKVLCLTDHSKHSKENSVYALLKAMRMHADCALVDVASRGIDQNAPFFKGEDLIKLYASPVKEDFGFNAEGKAYTMNIKSVHPADYDIIFLRLPRPITDEFLLQLKRTFKQQIFINNPEGIIKCSNKAFLLNFPGLCPPIRFCKSIEEILDFSKQYETVLKPLREYGGKGLLRINGALLNDGKQNWDTVDYLKQLESYIETEGFLAMKFLKNVSKGDKRLLVVNGKVLAASLRLPAENSWLCNVAQGGKSVSAEADEQELEIIEKTFPLLHENGILIAGIDTLVNDDGKRVLSEINALSIGGFPQAEGQTGKPIIKQTMNYFFDYAKQHKDRS